MNGTPPTDGSAVLQQALATFVNNDPGRSIALRFSRRQIPDASTDGDEPVTLHINGDTPRPVASVIKVALVMALYDLAAAGHIALAEQVPLSALGTTRYCSIMKAFDRGRSLSLAELAAISLITSDNPVAVMLEDRVGQDAVNAVLANAGIAPDRRMRVGFREHELGPKNRANVLSALDCVALFDLLVSDARYAPIVVALENNLRNARVPALLPDEAVIAHKTGSLEGVVNDAGIVRMGGNSFTIACLCDDQSDPAKTSVDMAACARAVFDILLAP